MKHEWKQTIFQPQDFDGAGQYIIREGINKENSPIITDTGYLSTIMFKVGYLHYNKNRMAAHIMCLISMSDGMISEGYYTGTKDIDGNQIDSSLWEYHDYAAETSHEAHQKLCEYLNNSPHKETFRFATNEELVRVALHQKYRTKN